MHGIVAPPPLIFRGHTPLFLLLLSSQATLDYHSVLLEIPATFGAIDGDGVWHNMSYPLSGLRGLSVTFRQMTHTPVWRDAMIW